MYNCTLFNIGNIRLAPNPNLLISRHGFEFDKKIPLKNVMLT